mmetsp:Transcript_4772/g.9488  ORF Transcript_4772/g.9488 Transcript_4772/m.9488 type:complete len:254 (+) Transcript_4772:476-1237(+)
MGRTRQFGRPPRAALASAAAAEPGSWWSGVGSTKTPAIAWPSPGTSGPISRGRSTSPGLRPSSPVITWSPWTPVMLSHGPKGMAPWQTVVLKRTEGSAACSATPKPPPRCSSPSTCTWLPTARPPTTVGRSPAAPAPRRGASARSRRLSQPWGSCPPRSGSVLKATTQEPPRPSASSAQRPPRRSSGRLPRSGEWKGKARSPGSASASAPSAKVSLCTSVPPPTMPPSEAEPTTTASPKCSRRRRPAGAARAP